VKLLKQKAVTLLGEHEYFVQGKGRNPFHLLSSRKALAGELCPVLRNVLKGKHGLVKESPEESSESDPGSTKRET